MLFLGNIRAALLVALAIPLSLLFAFSGMLRFGITASLLSLGALDFGMVVDSSVVMVENVVRHISHGDNRRSMIDIVRDAAIEVRKPTLFGELIIMIVYLPILTLEGVEGKMFRPMALTVIFALAGSMVLSLTLMPVLASLVLSTRAREREPLLMRLAYFIYAPLLRLSMRFKFPVLIGAIGILVVAFGMIAPNLGREFVPRLSEGAMVLTFRLAGIDVDEAARYNTMMEKTLLANFPDEVAHVWSRVGSAEIATDPMGVEETDFFISLKPRDRWKKAATQDDLTKLIQEHFRDMPGQTLAYYQPIEQRVDELTSGVRANLAIKIYGDDLKVLREKANEVADVLREIKGPTDAVTVEQMTGQPIMQIRIDQEQIAHYGIPAKAVLDVISRSAANKLATLSRTDPFPLVVRLMSLIAPVDQLGPNPAADRCRRAHSTSAVGSLRESRGGFEDQPRLGPTPRFGQRQHPQPRSGKFCGGGSKSRQGESDVSLRALSPGMGRDHRALRASQEAALDCSAYCTVLDFCAPVHDLSQSLGRHPRLFGSAVRSRRWDFRVVAARHAFFHFRGCGLHRPVRRGGSG